MSADSEHGWKFSRDSDSQGSVSTSPAENTRTASGETNDRVVARPHNGPVVHQKMICDVFQASSGFVVADCDRLITPVAAGHDQRERAFLHQ